MNKLVKIFLMLIITIILISVSTPIFALDIVDLLSQVNDKANDDSVINVLAQNSSIQVAGQILGLIRWISIIAGVVIITIFGFKYMMGSLEQKAEYKKSFIPLIVGIVVVMASSTIASIIISTFT